MLFAKDMRRQIDSIRDPFHPESDAIMEISLGWRGRIGKHDDLFVAATYEFELK